MIIIDIFVGPRRWSGGDHGFTGIGPNFAINSPSQVQKGSHMTEGFQGSSPSSATSLFGLLQEERQRFDSLNTEIRDQQVLYDYDYILICFHTAFKVFIKNIQ